MAGMKRGGVLALSVTLGALAGAGAVVAQRDDTRTRPEPRFDPDEIARIECEGWRAYYDRNFPRGFKLLMELAHGQFALGYGEALRASYYAVRGQQAFAGERGSAGRALSWMTRYYDVSPRRAGVDPADLAAAEIDYWVVHRRLVREPDKTDLIDSFCRLHALIFGGAPESMRPSAEQRTLACNVVDRITGKTSTNVDEDWRRVREHLTNAYRLAVEAAAPPRLCLNDPLDRYATANATIVVPKSEVHYKRGSALLTQCLVVEQSRARLTQSPRLSRKNERPPQYAATDRFVALLAFTRDRIVK